MATSNITDQNLARLVTQAGDDALALQQIATFYGLSAGDLSQITGIVEAIVIQDADVV